MVLDTVLQLASEAKKVDELCAPSKDAADRYRQLLKELYDGASASGSKQLGPLLQLTVAALDDESIWEQLQTRTNPLLRYVEKTLKKLKKRLEEQSQMEVEEEVAEESDGDEEEEDEECDAEQDDSEEDPSSEEEHGSDSDDADFDEERDDYVEESDGEGNEVDDDEGDEGDDEPLDDNDRMEAWLDREDELEMERQYKAEKRGGRGDEDEDDIDGPEAEELRFVQQTLYDSSDDDEEGDGEGGADSKFSDFFVAEKPRGKKSAGGKGKEQRGKKVAQRQQESDSEEEDEDGDDEDEEGMDEDAEGDEEEDGEGFSEEDDEGEGSEGEGAGSRRSSGKAKSETAAPARTTAAGRRNQALAAQIAELEGDLMAEKPWELRGEVKAGDRPENSFLSLHADIERTSKPAPIVTQAFTTSMEEMIKRRVKEGNFSDVLPPPPQKDGDAGHSDEQELSQEKNKLGLGEVYAEDFLAKSLNAQPEAVSKRLEQDRLEAQELFHKISRQLDALSHFHFTPRPVVADTKLKTLQPSASAVASLLLEDITPVTVLGGNASQLAPEQVQAKKHGKDGAMMAEEEMTSEDRKRKRRASKAANKAKKTRAADEAMYTDKQATGPGAAAARAREEARTLDEELKRDSRVTLTTGSQGSKKGGAGAVAPSGSSGSGNTSFAKSSSFFTKLQQETSDNIKKKTAQKGGKAPVVNPFTKSVNSLKL